MIVSNGKYDGVPICTLKLLINVIFKIKFV